MSLSADAVGREVTIDKLSKWLPNVGAKWIVFDTIGVGAFAIARSVLVAGVKAARTASRRKGSATIEISGKAVHIRWQTPQRRGCLTLASMSTVDAETGSVSVTEWRRPRGPIERKKAWGSDAKGHFTRYLHPTEYERVVVPAPVAP